MTRNLNFSEPKACGLTRFDRNTYRYKPKCKSDTALKVRLKQLSSEHPRYGYLMLHALLKSEELFKMSVTESHFAQ